MIFYHVSTCQASGLQGEMLKGDREIGSGGANVNLPLVFSRCLVEDVFLAVHGQDTVLHNALPVHMSIYVLQKGYSEV